MGEKNSRQQLYKKTVAFKWRVGPAEGVDECVDEVKLRKTWRALREKSAR
jgi:hypothetical protein